MKKVFITGISSGLGEELAHTYHRLGCHVWGVARRPKNPDWEKNLAGPGRGGSPFQYTPCDVSDPNQVRSTAEEMAKAGFIPDLVILNAGINEASPKGEFSHKSFERVLQTNLTGQMIFVEIFLPLFLKRGSGHFVAISSLSAYHATLHTAAYSASKAGLALAFESLRVEFRPRGIDFTTVFLGFMKSPLTAGRKPTPGGCTTKQAARRIIRGIERKERVIHYPRTLSLAALALSRLPKFIYDPLIFWIYKRTHL